MKEKLIKTMDLKNGMQLKFYDNSRKLAGDRWLISLNVRMEIPVTEVSINDKGKSIEIVNEIKEVLGEKVLFEQKRERIFVAQSEKQAVFEELYDFFIDSVLGYLSNKAFPKRYVLKKYREKVEKESWYH
jgi:rRNA maturation protein Rpf1